MEKTSAGIPETWTPALCCLLAVAAGFEPAEV